MVAIFSSYEATITSIAIAMVAIVNKVGRKKSCENTEVKLVITALVINVGGIVNMGLISCQVELL